MTLKERVEYADNKIDLACKEYGTPSVGYWRGYRDALCELFLIEPESPRDWTTCAEGVPEFTNFYNVTVGVGGMLGYYEETRTYRYLKVNGEEPKWVIPDRFCEVVHVLAWQPLPLPWTGEKKGE